MSNIAIFSPSKNPYSETFIQAHKNFLKGNIFYYYGGKYLALEGHPPLASVNDLRLLRLQKKLFREPDDFIMESTIVNSLRKHKIDVVLVEYGTHANWLLPFIKKAGLPLVVHFHGYDASAKHIVEKNGRYRELFRHASKVIAVSRKMEMMLLEMGCPREKLAYNANAPQTEFMDVQPSFSKKHFIGIGRFTDKKAPYYTILAFKEVIGNHPDAKLIMAGDGELLNTCKNLVRHFGLADQVEFPGVISPETYRKLLSESVGFVQHSVTASSGDMEGMPIAVLEASAAGLPVISTNHAGIPDVIVHGRTGLLCEEHDVAGMAENMVRILDDVEYARELGGAGKRHILEYYSMERHIEELQGILEGVVG